MKMIPSAPHDTQSNAEKIVFDQLRVAFESDPSLVAFHSLNLPRHNYKRFGEIDFLICGTPGIFVLEIKGGRIGCKNGIWNYTNRYGEISTSVEGPFKQAQSALHGLISKLRDHIPNEVLSQFTIGYGVIFPFIEWRIQGAEWDPMLLADARQVKNIEHWLLKLFEYWRCKASEKHPPSPTALDLLKRILRPEFEIAEALYIQADQVENKIATLTEDQMIMVDVVTANPRVLCSGGAGTGKTFLALELSRRWTAEGQKVLIVCRSNWLKHYIESRFVFPGVNVSLVNSIQTALKRADLRYFDALIVDEGQDLINMDCLERLGKAIKGGLENGRWCFFCDINNQSGAFGEVDQKAIAFLNGCNPAQLPLKTNCRNTRVILEKVQSDLGADMGVRGAGHGPAIRELEADTPETSAVLLEKELFEIIDEGGIPAGSVTILSPLTFTESTVAFLSEKSQNRITPLDEFSLRSFQTRDVGFAEIHNFKGLENEAIIVVDLARPSKDNESVLLHYLAMSRARAVLSLIYRKDLLKETTS